jgi:hypothetical protein
MDMANSMIRETPTVTFSPDNAANTTERYPATIFGKLPDELVLEEQQIQVLMHWYRKAIATVERLPDDASDDELDTGRDIVRRLYTAILAAKTHNAGNVALKLQAILMKLDTDKSDSIEEALNVEDIRRLAEELSDATKPLAPTRKVGSLRRGRKLTRIGLLCRYQSFLTKELHTLSLNLYGNRDYALQYIEEDDAVNLRCRNGRHPFFDESKLADRARSVLKSLKVDTKEFDVLGRHGTTWVTSEKWPGR